MTEIATDVLIVGAGPAGSSLAWGLRNSGLQVDIIDKASFPRDKVCAGWVTPEVFRLLEVDLDDYAQQRVLQPIHGFRVSKIPYQEIQTSFGDTTVSYGIRRCEFDHYLLQRSQATFHAGEKFVSLQREGDSWLVNDKYRSKIVIGAGGHFCPVARFMGARPGSSEPTVVAQEIEFNMSEQQRLNCAIKEDIPELFFCEDLQGYGWVFRKGDYLNIGLGREDSQRLGEHVQAFVRFLKLHGRIPEDVPEKWHGHAYLLYPHAPRQLVDDGLLLVGDAAGLAYPQSGEGIRPAVESGLIAAMVLQQLHGNYTKQELQAYVTQLSARFGQRQPAASLLERLPAWLRQGLASGLMRQEWFVRNVVMKKWFLQQQQSPLKLA